MRRTFGPTLGAILTSCNVDGGRHLIDRTNSTLIVPTRMPLGVCLVEGSLKMKALLIVLCVWILASTATSADVAVKGYYRKNGTYVQPHYRSDPNGTKADNWSTFGNINPHTGKIGTKRYNENSSYESDRSIESIARDRLGGCYYIECDDDCWDPKMYYCLD